MFVQAQFGSWCSNLHRNADGTALQVAVREPEEIALVGGGQYAASQVGWGADPRVSFGRSPEEAVDRYNKGLFF